MKTERAVNVAYSQVLSYNELGDIVHVNSNLHDYDIHPLHTANCLNVHEMEKRFKIKLPYTLKKGDCEYLRQELNRFFSQALETFMDNSNKTFKTVTLEEVYEKEENFLYPIVLYDNNLFYKYETIELDTRVIERAHQGKAKICFIQPTEGHFGSSNNEFEWLYRLSERFNFSKEAIVVITANLKSPYNYNYLVDSKIIEDTYKVYPFSYFQHDLWFLRNGNGKALHSPSVESSHELFKLCLRKNKDSKKQKHFLCFNRISRVHRVLLFGEIQTNNNLKDKTIITLGKDKNFGTNDGYFKVVQYYLEDNYKFSKEKLLNFYKEYDATQEYTYDVTDLEKNQAENLNITAHNNTFLNLVTETLTDPHTIFFSEKIFKPIFCAQPFVLFGNPFSLRKLKEYGFLTFDKWWDESYDDEIDLTRRLEKIVETLEYISKWDLDKCFQVTQEMESIFINNFDILRSNQKVLELQKDLCTFNIIIAGKKTNENINYRRRKTRITLC